MQVNRVEDRAEVEKPILVGMIVSTDFLRKYRRRIKLEYFQLDYVRTVAQWVLEYFDQFNLAPIQHVNDLFTVNSINLKSEEKQLIELLLSSLSTAYENLDTYNEEYIEKKTDEYFLSRSLSLLSTRIQALVGIGKIKEAEEELLNYKGIQKELSGWVDVFKSDFVQDTFNRRLSPEMDKPIDALYKMPGAIGDLMGWLERGWLISLLAPRKRGKSYMLAELALQAVQNRLNVAVISLEMNEVGFGGRFLQAVTALGKESIYKFTVFDCVKNQNGSCTDPRRTNLFTLLENDKIPVYDSSNPYRVCTACRQEHYSEYKSAYWYETRTQEVITENKFKKWISSFAKLNGHLVLKAYPAFSASASDIKRDLETLENTMGFQTDVLVIDYADIIGPENARDDALTKTDTTWKMLKNLAATKHILVLTATQGNRSSDESKNVKATQVSWDIRKNDHVDVQFALSQTPEEKRAGVMRVSNTLHRWQEFDGEKFVYVLQNLKLSQVLMDSEWV